MIVAAVEHQWAELCNAMGSPELTRDPRFENNSARLAHLKEMEAVIEGWLASGFCVAARDEISAVKSSAWHQPSSPAEEDAAWRAALVCPTGSIKRDGGGSPPKVYFPEEIAHGVFRCGFNARASYGAHSYFVQRREGNLLIDSPRYIRRLESFFEEHGGIAAVLLTHRDDVCDADRYATRFASGTWIHEAHRSAAPFASDIIAGDSREQSCQA